MLWLAMAVSIAVLVIGLTTDIIGGGTWVAIGLALATWLLASHVIVLRDRLKHKGIGGLATDLRGHGRSFYGMWIAHVGVVLFIVGVTMVQSFQQEVDIRMSPGDSHEIAGYRFEFLGAEPKDGPNYRAQRGHFRVYDGAKQIAELYPEKRSYLGGGMPMTEAAIDAGLLRDIYVSLGEPVGGGDWALRLYYKPYVRWIWLAAILMAIGGGLAVSDPRYRTAKRRQTASAPAGQAATAGARA
jgi:cytochrome c-type biogenesis protein CcmF